MSSRPDDAVAPGRSHRSPVPSYLTSFVFLGMALTVAGPALPHLRERAGVGIGASGFVLAGQSFGYILGSLAAGRRYDRGHGHRLLLGAGAVAVAGVFGLAAVRELWLVVAAFVLIGFSSAGVDVGGNTLVVWSQPAHRVGSTLNALHLCFGAGALVTPLVVSASLALTDGLVLVAVVMAAVLLAVAVPLRGTQHPSRRAAAHHDDVVPTRSSRLAFALLCAFFFVYVGAEVAFAGWLSTYAEEIRLGGDDTPAILTSVFFGGFAAGRVMAVWLTRRISLAGVLVSSCLVSVVASFALATGDSIDAVVWICTALVGCSLGPQYATMLAFGDDRLRLSGSSTSLIIASSGVGGLTLPIATGWVLDGWGASLLPWAIGTSCVLTTILVAMALALGRQRPPATSMNVPVT